MTSIRHISYKIRLTALAVVVCSILAATRSGLILGLYDSAFGGPKPICHDLIMGNIQQYLVEQGNKGDGAQSYPNAAGDSQKSMDAFTSMMDPAGKSRFYRDYAYIPGLRSGDPKNLILVYMAVPTGKLPPRNTADFSLPSRTERCQRPEIFLPPRPLARKINIYKWNVPGMCRLRSATILKCMDGSGRLVFLGHGPRRKLARKLTWR